MKRGLAVLVIAIIVVVGVFVLWQLGILGGKGPAPTETIPVPAPPIETPPITPTVTTPITPTMPTPTLPSQPEGENYTVKKGDTLWKIARIKYGDGAKYKIIEEANKDKITDPAKIKPGMVLFIPKLESIKPKPESVEPPKPKAKYHTVKKDDTLKRLALRYYQDASKANLIFEANRDKLATMETTLKIGWKLTIPPESKESPVPSTPITPSGAPE